MGVSHPKDLRTDADGPSLGAAVASIELSEQFGIEYQPKKSKKRAVSELKGLRNKYQCGREFVDQSGCGDDRGVSMTGRAFDSMLCHQRDMMSMMTDVLKYAGHVAQGANSRLRTAPAGPYRSTRAPVAPKDQGFGKQAPLAPRLEQKEMNAGVRDDESRDGVHGRRRVRNRNRKDTKKRETPSKDNLDAQLD